MAGRDLRVGGHAERDGDEEERLVLAGDRVGRSDALHDQLGGPSAPSLSTATSPTSAPGMVMKPCGRPSELIVEEQRAVPDELSGGVADDEVGRGAERVLVEDEAIDQQRVVDPDDLARHLLAVAIDGEVGAEVGERAVGAPGRREVVDLDQQVARRADGARTGALWPSPTNTTVSKPPPP